MSIIKLRPASITDLPVLLYWDQQQHVIDCDPDSEWNWEEELKSEFLWREQLIAELDDNPIGFIQIIDPHAEESHYWGDIAENLRAIDIWIGEKENLRKGYGTMMMRMAVKRCFENKKVKAVLVDPLETNIEAHSFYKRLGFVFVERRIFGNDKCVVYRLDREHWMDS